MGMGRVKDITAVVGMGRVKDIKAVVGMGRVKDITAVVGMGRVKDITAVVGMGRVKDITAVGRDVNHVRVVNVTHAAVRVAHSPMYLSAGTKETVQTTGPSAQQVQCKPVCVCS